MSLIGKDRYDLGTRSLRRTKATPIDRQTQNPRAVQLLLRYTKPQNAVRHFGIERDDVLETAEHIEV